MSKYDMTGSELYQKEKARIEREDFAKHRVAARLFVLAFTAFVVSILFYGV